MIDFLRYETHGHSTYSDGHDSPIEIVRAAIGKVDILAISDHNSVQGLPEFLDEVTRVNDEGFPLIPIPSVEVSTTEGHLILAVSEPDTFKGFLRWTFNTRFFHAEPEGLITTTVQEFGGHCIFTHPEVPASGGFKLEDIDRVIDTLPADTIPNLAVEIYNGSALLLPFVSSVIAKRIHRWNERLGLAEVAGNDFHTKHLIGNLTNIVPTGETATEAIKKRSIRPVKRFITPRAFLLTVISHGAPLMKYKSIWDPTDLSAKILRLIGN